MAYVLLLLLALFTILAFSSNNIAAIHFTHDIKLYTY